MPKGTSCNEATLNGEKIKPIALAIIELRLSEGISQSVRRKFLFFVKFHSNLLKAFRGDLKTCLGLVLPNQYCFGNIEAGFWVMCFCRPHFHLCGPYYTVLLYCMIMTVEPEHTTTNEKYGTRASAFAGTCTQLLITDSKVNLSGHL